jgi:hypothetical protein
MAVVSVKGSSSSNAWAIIFAVVQKMRYEMTHCIGWVLLRDGEMAGRSKRSSGMHVLFSIVRKEYTPICFCGLLSGSNVQT